MIDTNSSTERLRSLRETVLMAGASGVNFALSLLRTKVLAVAWGPPGMGAMGMMQASMSTAGLVAGVGVDGIVTRELAKAQPHDPVRVAELLSAVTRGVAVLAGVGALLAGLVLFVLRERLGLGSLTVVVLLSIGVFASVSAANLRGTLSAMGLLRPLASAGVLAGGIATVIAGALALLPANAETWALAVLLVPLVQWLAIARAFRQVPSMPKQSWRASILQVGLLSKQSGLLAVAGILPMLSQLLVRSLARDGLSVESFGCFQASMALAATSVSVLASSVGPSVLPRLSAAASNEDRLSAVVNEQTGVYLTLFAPVAIALVALPELVVLALYSSSFEPVADQLSWQMVGEVARLPCWVLATVLTARGRMRSYLFVEAASLLMLVAGVGFAARTGNLSLVGVAISASALGQFLLLTALTRQDGVRWSSSLAWRLLLLMAVIVFIAAFARVFVVARVVAIIFVLVALGRAVRTLSALRSPPN